MLLFWLFPMVIIIIMRGIMLSLSLFIIMACDKVHKDFKNYDTLLCIPLAHHHQHHIRIHAAGGSGLAILLILMLSPCGGLLRIIACRDTNHGEEEEGEDRKGRLHLSRIIMV